MNGKKCKDAKTNKKRKIINNKKHKEKEKR